MLLRVTKAEKAKSELKPPELATNHPVGDKKGLIIGCLYLSGHLSEQRRRHCWGQSDARTLTWTALRAAGSCAVQWQMAQSDPEGSHLNMYPPALQMIHRCGPEGTQHPPAATPRPWMQHRDSSISRKSKSIFKPICRNIPRQMLTS